MTAPNWFGYTETEERAALRRARREAEYLAGQMKPQMDEFLNCVGAAIENPNEAMYYAKGIANEVHAAYMEAQEPDEAARQEAEIATYDGWKDEAIAEHDDWLDEQATKESVRP